MSCNRFLQVIHRLAFCKIGFQPDQSRRAIERRPVIERDCHGLACDALLDVPAYWVGGLAPSRPSPPDVVIHIQRRGILERPVPQHIFIPQIGRRRRHRDQHHQRGNRQLHGGGRRDCDMVEPEQRRIDTVNRQQQTRPERGISARTAGPPGCMRPASPRGTAAPEKAARHAS